MTQKTTKNSERSRSIKLSEKMKDRFFDLSLDLICIAGMDGYFKYVNPIWEKVLGYDIDELLSKPFLDFIHPDDHKKNDEELKKLSEGKLTIGFENRYVCSDGSIRHISWTAAPVKDDELIYCVGRDITDYKRAENEAIAYREFMDSVPGYGFAKDINHKYVSANRTFCDLLKIPYDQIKGKTDFDIFPAELAEKYILDDKRVIETGKPLIVEEETINANTNEMFYVVTRKHPWFDEKGNVIGIYGMGFDATDIKKAERELDKFKNFLRYTVDGLSENVALLKEDGEIVLVNKAWLKFAEENGADMKTVSVGASYFDACKTESGEWLEDAEEFREGLEKILSNQVKSYSIEYPCHSEDKKRWFIATMSAYPIENSRFIVIAHENITDRKQFEMRLQQNHDQLNSLYDLSKTINTSLTPDEVIEKALKRINLIIQPDISFFFLREADELILQRVEPPDNNVIFSGVEKHKVGECMCGLAVSQNQALYSTNIFQDTRCTWDECKEAGLRSFAALPLRSGKKVVGIIGIASKEERDFEQQSEYLELISDQISLTLIKSEIYKKLQSSKKSLQTSLKEKDILLRELYHRTKNNLQVISSMLRMKARTYKDLKSSTAFLEIDNKILSMALVHQKLYESKNLSRIHLLDYIEDLAKLLRSSLSVPARNLKVKVEGKDIFVLFDTALPIGLIINELFSNSSKYAFRQTEKNEIHLHLTSSAEYDIILEYRDSGPGLPQDFDPKKDGNLGLQTVVDLAESQLQGKVEFKRSNGFYARISIKSEYYMSRI